MLSLTFWSKTVVTTSETPDSLPSDVPADPRLSSLELPMPKESHSATEDASSAVPQRDNSVQPTDEMPSTTPSTLDPQQPAAVTATNPTSLDVPEPRPRKASMG